MMPISADLLLHSDSFRPCRHRLTAIQHRHEMTSRFTIWNGIFGLFTAA